MVSPAPINIEALLADALAEVRGLPPDQVRRVLAAVRAELRGLGAPLARAVQAQGDAVIVEGGQLEAATCYDACAAEVVRGSAVALPPATRRLVDAQIVAAAALTAFLNCLGNCVSTAVRERWSGPAVAAPAAAPKTPSARPSPEPADIPPLLRRP